MVRADGTPHTSLVNAGVLDHPRTGEPAVGYVTDGPVKLRTLRERPATSILWRAGRRWAAVDGECELLRAVFSACGGTHDDRDTYDRVMRDEGRVAVLVTPRKVYGNA